jgi:hypothetical protein
MRLVAIYKVATGEITALCALPPDPTAPSPGMQLRPGESLAELDVPDEFMPAGDDSQLQARMEAIVRSHRIETTRAAKIVKYA